MEVTLHEQIECVERELRMRQRVYPRWVKQGKMTPEGQQKEMARMAAVLDTLHRVRAGALVPADA